MTTPGARRSEFESGLPQLAEVDMGSSLFLHFLFCKLGIIIKLSVEFILHIKKGLEQCLTPINGYYQDTNSLSPFHSGNKMWTRKAQILQKLPPSLIIV